MTHSELRDRMRLYANVDDVRLDDDTCTDFLNSAQREIMESYRLRFGEAYITTAFVEDVQIINPAPTSGHVLHPTRLWYSDATTGERCEVDQISWNEYIEKWGTAATAEDGSGDPENFAVYGESDLGHPTIYLGPIPDESRVAYLTARIRFEDLDADDDENQLTTEAPLAVIYRALEMASTHLELSERVPEWNAQFDRVIKSLALSHSAARYSGKHLRSMQEPG